MTVLLTCSGGGHLRQLHSLVPRMGFGDEDRLWVTFDTGLSRSLLAGEDVVFATYAAPRDALNIARNAAQAVKLLRGHRFSAAVSTGSSLAVNYLPLSGVRGVPSHFVETAARAAGPSMTGRILHRTPRVTTYTQYPAWSGGRWLYGGSVFDEYTPGPERQAPGTRRAVVTLGTTESYEFRSMVERLAPLLEGWDVLWQTGSTRVTAPGVQGREHVPYQEIVAAVEEADVVISHAGTGAALTALASGKVPVLVPRRLERGEHVDDHQVQIAAELDRRGLAVHAEVDQLSPEVLARAASQTAVRRTAVPPFRLVAP